jgi:hypothetical protein
MRTIAAIAAVAVLPSPVATGARSSSRAEIDDGRVKLEVRRD